MGDSPAAGNPADPARVWWTALAQSGEVSIGAGTGRRLLAGVLARIEVAMRAQPFDAAAGAVIGAQLAAIGWCGPEVPAISGRVLLAVAEEASAETRERLVMLVAALGRGHREYLCDGVAHRATDDRSGSDDHDDLLRLLFENSSAAIMIGNIRGNILAGNRTMADLLGLPVEKLAGASVRDIVHPDDRELVQRRIYGELVPTRSGVMWLQNRLARQDDRTVWVEFGITYVRNPGGPDYLIGVGGDVTERHRLQQELRYQARHDPLTGLPNRRYLLDALAEMRTHADAEDRVGLCFADVDRFKQVNDSYGHSVGDKLLAAVGDRLRRGSGDGTQYLVARIGGDEFVALVPPPASRDRVTAVARSMAAAVDEPIVVDGHRLRISVSVGTIVASITEADAGSLLDAADDSLYTAKARPVTRASAAPATALWKAYGPRALR